MTLVSDLIAARAQHTPGPWAIDDVLANGHRKVRGPSALVAVVGNGERTPETFEANARLIAAAPDHALIVRAMCVGAGRWEPFGDGRGEFCMNGLRHATELDEFGCPRMTDAMRRAISKALGEPQPKTGDAA